MPKKQTQIMYIEFKGGGLTGSARIGRVSFSKTGKTIYYDGKTLHTLSGSGYKSNYYDVNTDEEYWISGCRKDGVNALYNTDVEIDEDAAEEYWVDIRNMPDNKHILKFRMSGKY